MAKKENPTRTAIKGIVEVLTQDVGAQSGRSLLNAFEDNLKRVSPDVLRALAGASHLMAGLVQAPLERALVPLVGAETAGMVAEGSEAFFRESARRIRELKDKSDANVQAVVNDQATLARQWVQVRSEIVEQMQKQRGNFNHVALAGLGDVSEQARITRLVNTGLELLAASPDPHDWELATGVDLSTTENLRVFADAVRRARREKAAGRDHLSSLRGTAMGITKGDAIALRVLSAMGVNIARSVRDGARDGVKWTAEQFMDRVWPVAQAQGKYTEPTRRTDRGWWGRLLNPTANWSFRDANLRMKFEWLGETLGGMLSAYAKLIALTMGIFFATSLSMLAAGHADYPVFGMVLAGIGAFMGYIAFVVNVTYAPLAIDLGRFLVGSPLLLLNELLNIFGGREERVEMSLSGPTVSHLRDIRWRVAMATLGLPTFLLLASMIVGPNVKAFVAAFGLGGVSALVSVGAHFYANDDLNKKLVYGGTIVTFPILFVIALLSVANAGAYYGYDTSLQFNAFYDAGVLNLGQALYLSLPVFALTMVLSAVSLRYVFGIKSSSFPKLVWGGVAIVTLAFSVWVLDSWIPRRDTPLVHVPVGMEQHVRPKSTAVTQNADTSAQGTTSTGDLYPWEETSDEEIGDF